MESLPNSLANILPVKGTKLRDTDATKPIPFNVSSVHKAIILKYYLDNVSSQLELMGQDIDMPMGLLFVVSSPLFCMGEKMSNELLCFVKKWNRARNTQRPSPTLSIAKSVRKEGYELTISVKHEEHDNMMLAENDTHIITDDRDLMTILELFAYVSVIESNGRKLW